MLFKMKETFSAKVDPRLSTLSVRPKRAIKAFKLILVTVVDRVLLSNGYFRRIIKVMPGKDHVTKVLEIHILAGIITRSVSQVAVLPFPRC